MFFVAANCSSGAQFQKVGRIEGYYYQTGSKFKANSGALLQRCLEGRRDSDKKVMFENGGLPIDWFVSSTLRLHQKLAILHLERFLFFTHLSPFCQVPVTIRTIRWSWQIR